MMETSPVACCDGATGRHGAGLGRKHPSCQGAACHQRLAPLSFGSSRSPVPPWQPGRRGEASGEEAGTAPGAPGAGRSVAGLGAGP